MARITSCFFSLGLVFTLAGCDAKDEPEGLQGLACVEPSVLDFEINVTPTPVQEDGEVSFDGACSVTSVSDSPLSLKLSCEGAPTPEIAVSVSGSPDVSWTSVLSPGAAVDVRYATYWRADLAPTWLVIRLMGETDPAVIVVESHAPLPHYDAGANFMSPVALNFLADTDCAESPGSCNKGVQRRSAVEATINGSETVVVFDHDETVASSYEIVVGDARVDEGNCEEANATWYELLITRVGAG